MATLNMVLQHQSCERTPMAPYIEELFQSESSMKKLRTMIEALDDDGGGGAHARRGSHGLGDIGRCADGSDRGPL